MKESMSEINTILKNTRGMANMAYIRKVKAKNGNRACSLPEGTIKDTKIKHVIDDILELCSHATGGIWIEARQYIGEPKVFRWYNGIETYCPLQLAWFIKSFSPYDPFYPIVRWEAAAKFLNISHRDAVRITRAADGMTKGIIYKRIQTFWQNRIKQEFTASPSIRRSMTPSEIGRASCRERVYVLV